MRCSDSVAEIASALAQAQLELANPEKAAIGHIMELSGREVAFKYASLASGLEIVRKVLGNHKIAVTQATDVDRSLGLVNLTTKLMHASGQWLSSEWPVCRISDTATPRRMGAALTYARRYALFAMVGIAGEDDLDSPEFRDGNQESSRSSNAANRTAPSTPILPAAIKRAPTPSSTHIASTPAADGEANSKAESGARAGQMETEIAAITDEETLQSLAGTILKRKNQLLDADAKRVENAFLLKLSSLQSSDFAIEGPGQDKTQPSKISADKRKRGRARELSAVTKVEDQHKIDKSTLSLSEPKRRRDKQHLRFVAMQPCLICGRAPSDAHHLRFVQPRAMGLKSSDEFTVPLCRTHHRENHSVGAERDWWKKKRLDPLATAASLWLQSRGKGATIETFDSG